MDPCNDCDGVCCPDCGEHYCCDPCPCGHNHICDCACRGYGRRVDAD